MNDIRNKLYDQEYNLNYDIRTITELIRCLRLMLVRE